MNSPSSACHNYGQTHGCDINCPALLDGECAIPIEVIEQIELTEEEELDIKELYGILNPIEFVPKQKHKCKSIW